MIPVLSVEELARSIVEPTLAVGGTADTVLLMVKDVSAMVVSMLFSAGLGEETERAMCQQMQEQPEDGSDLALMATLGRA